MSDTDAPLPEDLAPIGSVLIKPVSARCNLACRYCFYLDRPTDPYRGVNTPAMPDEVLDRLASGFEEYSHPVSVFAWQGGEPTLAGLDFFRGVVDRQRRHGTRGQVVSNSLQTNGMLLDEAWAEFFAEYRFLVGLSLDGPRDIHDRFRTTRAGRGSWERVMESWRVLRDRGVEANVLCCVHEGNADRAAELHAFFRDLGVGHVQYIPIAEYAPDGSPRPGTVDAAAYGRFLCDLFDAWWPDRRTVCVRWFDNLLEALLGRRPGSCTMHRVCESYLVVEHNGDVYPCDFFVHPDWRIGNVVDDSFEDLARAPVRRKFAARKLIPRPECGECDYAFLCRNGCPKLRHARHSRFEDLDTFCESYRVFFAHALPRLRDLAEELRAASSHAPVVVGRNDPCPCGSGRKFKKCCGRGTAPTP